MCSEWRVFTTLQEWKHLNLHATFMNHYKCYTIKSHLISTEVVTLVHTFQLKPLASPQKGLEVLIRWWIMWTPQASKNGVLLAKPIQSRTQLPQAHLIYQLDLHLSSGGSSFITKKTGQKAKPEALNTWTPSVFIVSEKGVGSCRKPPGVMCCVYAPPSYLSLRVPGSVPFSFGSKQPLNKDRNLWSTGKTKCRPLKEPFKVLQLQCLPWNISFTYSSIGSSRRCHQSQVQQSLSPYSLGWGTSGRSKGKFDTFHRVCVL